MFAYLRFYLDAAGPDLRETALMTKPYTPQLAWPKLEIHVDYRCDLMCTSCSRGSFLRKPHTPPITLAQIK